MKNILAVSLSAFAIVSGITTAAEARKGCFCKLRTSCRGQIAKDFGAVESYRDLEFGKKRKCANACNQATKKAKSGLTASKDTLCKKLGTGNYVLQSYSVVGAKDNNVNTCEVDFTMPSLRCSTPCGCPAGMSAIPSPDGYMCLNMGNLSAGVISPVCSVESEWLP